jgi:hypothetical protein
MKKQLVLTAALALAVLVPAQSFASRNHKDKSKDAWIHIEVHENGDDGDKVSVNLPLSLADVALQSTIEEHGLSDGKITIDDGDITVTDLRRMWRELKNAGDAEFVTVESDDENVKVYRKGDRVYVDVDDHSEDQTVRVVMPVVVVDALLSGDDDRLDLRAALAELKELGSGDIVRVEGGDENVRIWID